ncbi:FG-GAP-like repeat-containing protein [Streptomyces sp. NPDC020141]|uniref:FG-GAP-like repeat-containing protein n=1 Tax=Streptomyces sp. NPDC020141 TaxID=3365065 RepID=UPI0037AAD0DD
MDTRRTIRPLGLLAALAAVTSLTAPAAFAAPAEKPASERPAAGKPAAPHGMKDDFNGDGYQDLAVGTPYAYVDGRTRAGHVGVVYGSKSGLNTSERQTIRQGADGIPGRVEAHDLFGYSLTSADLNRDGYADLVATSFGEHLTPEDGVAGRVTVIWGSAKGLARGATPAATMPGNVDSVAAGDFDGDGHQDLASGNDMGWVDVRHGPFAADGSPARESAARADWDDNRQLKELRAGDVNRDGITDLVGLHGWEDDSYWRPELVFWQGTATGLAPYRHLTDHRNKRILGDSLDVGDVNGDGYADLAVGLLYAGETDPEIPAGGKVTYIRGSAKGPLGAKNRIFHLDSPKVPGSSKDSYGFGASVSVGDLDGDRYGDIAVGVTGTNVEGRPVAGSVITLRGAASGPTSAGSRQFHQNTKDIPGTAEKGDAFGSHSKMIDANGDGRRELAVTAIGENNSTGMVWVLPTDKNGVTPKGSFHFGPTVFGLPADELAEFGSEYTG